MSAIAIAVDAARDAAQRRHTDAAESYTDRYERTSAAVFRDLRAASTADLGETLWCTLDGIGSDSRLELLDAVLSAARDLTVAEYGDETQRRLAMARVIAAYRIAEATAVERITDTRMREDV